MSAIRKKVLLGITQSNFGGAQRHVYDLATGLKGEYDVAVVYGGDGMLAQKLREAGVRGISISSLVRHVSFVSELRTLVLLVRLLRRERPDVLHVHSSKMGGLGVVAGRIACVPRIIFTAHGWEFNAPRSRVARRIIKLFSTCIVLGAHRTIAVSQAIKNDISFGPAQRKMTVVYSGIAPISFLPRTEARRALMDACPGLAEGRWIGSASELHPVKGLSYAIEAIAELKDVPDVRYIVMGEGSERSALEALIRVRSLEGRVFLAGQVQDARTYLKAFDLFLMPSLAEALGYAVIEAGYAELLAVASDVGGLPEIMTNEQTGLLVPARDSHAIAAALRRLLNDAAFSRRLAGALRTEVERRFSLETMLAGVREVYKS